MSVVVTRDLGMALSRINEQQLVILDARDESALALLCRRINDETGSHHPPILAVAHSHDVETRVRLLEAGADDVVAQPVDERELEALVEALMLRAPAPVPADTETAVARPRPDAVPLRGAIVAFTAAKGGSGTTTLAVNTALVLAEMAPGSVAIAISTCTTARSRPISTSTRATRRPRSAREDRSSQTPDIIHESGKQHSSGLMVFGGPYRPTKATTSTVISSVARRADAHDLWHDRSSMRARRSGHALAVSARRARTTSSCPSPRTFRRCASFTPPCRSCPNGRWPDRQDDVRAQRDLPAPDDHVPSRSRSTWASGSA